jgi:hypothetical protein
MMSLISLYIDSRTEQTNKRKGCCSCCGLLWLTSRPGDKVTRNMIRLKRRTNTSHHQLSAKSNDDSTRAISMELRELCLPICLTAGTTMIIVGKLLAPDIPQPIRRFETTKLHSRFTTSLLNLPSIFRKRTRLLLLVQEVSPDATCTVLEPQALVRRRQAVLVHHCRSLASWRTHSLSHDTLQLRVLGRHSHHLPHVLYEDAG